MNSRRMTVLELSAAEIAGLVGYSKSVVEAAFRWLGSEPITYFGLQLTHGLRYIERSRREANAFVAGVFREVYRTSKSRLTAIGGALVGILPAEESPSRCRGRHRKTPAVSENEAADPVEESEPDWEAKIRGLRRVLMMV